MSLFGFFNPAVNTSKACAKLIKREYGSRWHAFEKESNLVFASIVESRWPLKKSQPENHQQFVQDCLNGKFRTIQDFILEILRLEIYGGETPGKEFIQDVYKIRGTLQKQGIPQEFI